jgi:VWFA-related protein
MNKSLAKLVGCLHLCAAIAIAQAGQNASPSEQSDDVIKINTELVQTDVTVFDRQGRFVNGLKREDFELRVDGKPQPISFFDQVQAGSASEEAQLAAARGARSQTRAEKSWPVPLDRGRTVFFFVDDIHLAPASMAQTRKLLLRFIDRDLKQNDEAAIITASGHLGFLQQLTDSKVVLRTAVERLTARPAVRGDLESPPMSEYQALRIEGGDHDTLEYFVDEVLKDYPSLVLASAEETVRRRASAILRQASYPVIATLSSLHYLIRTCAKHPGRKLLFLISDGFFIDSEHSDSTERMRLISSAASRSNVVIYSIDARGLVADSTDAGSYVAIDTSGRLNRSGRSEIASSEAPLNALACDTGGRALFNSNDLYAAVEKSLKETAVYYLLAWRPARERDNRSKFRRLEVAVVGRPDLTVRVRPGIFDLDPPPIATDDKESRIRKAAEQTVAAKLMEAINAPYPARQIPVSLNLIYLDTALRGGALTALMQIDGEFLTFGADAGKRNAEVDLAGAVFDVSGKPGARFRERLVLSAATEPPENRRQGLTYTYGISLGPGLYQVRVVARDTRSGYVGGANAWIEIPDLSDHQLALSSLIVAERRNSDSAAVTPAGGSSLTDSVPASFDRRFKRDSYLRYMIFVYNSIPEPPQLAPDVAVQVQVFRDDQPVVTTVARKISADGVKELRRLPYAAELPLNGLPPGRYLLKLTVIDRVAKSSASQQMRFEIY